MHVVLRLLRLGGRQLIPVGHQPYLARAPTFRFSGTILSISPNSISTALSGRQKQKLRMSSTLTTPAILPELHLVSSSIHTLAFQASSRGTISTTARVHPLPDQSKANNPLRVDGVGQFPVHPF